MWRMVVPHCTHLEKERIATSMPENQAGVRVARRHHLLVRLSHWLNVPILLGLILSGVSIYSASPVHRHKPNQQTGSFDFRADIGMDVRACSRIAYYSSLRQFYCEALCSRTADVDIKSDGGPHDHSLKEG